MSLYSDGGVIKINPSPYGGTWSWVLVNQGKLEMSGAGVLSAEPGTYSYTNNYMELYAAVQGLLFVTKHLPKEWDGVLYVDSLVTKHRLGQSESFAGIDKELERAARYLRKITNVKVHLLAGHPTKKDLEQGYQTKKSGVSYPVSKWNAWCDQKCQELAKRFMQEHPNLRPSKSTD